MPFAPHGSFRLPAPFKTILLSLMLAAGPLACSAAPQAPIAPLRDEAFPGVTGYGAHADGGRGGRIIPVTTLDDSGPGSLRACIDAEGPRVCVFRVAGVIRFTSERPIIRNPYITIAGQTAPGGGILLAHDGGPRGLTPLVIKNTHDVIVRHIRVRPDKRGEIRGSNSAFIIERSHDVVLDHVSSSWSLDENVGGYAGNDNVTISSSIFAEGIPRHDKCALLSSDPEGPQHLTFIGNLCAHNGDRNPDINFPPKSCVEIVNNVLYNGQSEFAEVWSSYGGTPVSIVGNWFRSGPNTHIGAAAITRQMVGAKGAPRIYMSGNHIDGTLLPQTPNVAEVVVSQPPCPLISPVIPAIEAYERVLNNAGAFPRDSIDRRIVNDVRNRSGSIVSQAGTLPTLDPGIPYEDDDEDGMSDAWEQANALDPTLKDSWADRSQDGWSNLDEFLDFAHRELLAGRPVR
jgi:hypothetical protein